MMNWAEAGVVLPQPGKPVVSTMLYARPAPASAAAVRQGDRYVIDSAPVSARIRWIGAIPLGTVLPHRGEA